ncbi:hypothetical protein AMAG_18977, partial [Allomyces macrogynus ATCC 38327]
AHRWWVAVVTVVVVRRRWHRRVRRVRSRAVVCGHTANPAMVPRRRRAQPLPRDYPQWNDNGNFSCSCRANAAIVSRVSGDLTLPTTGPLPRSHMSPSRTYQVLPRISRAQSRGAQRRVATGVGGGLQPCATTQTPIRVAPPLPRARFNVVLCTRAWSQYPRTMWQS